MDCLTRSTRPDRFPYIWSYACIHRGGDEMEAAEWSETGGGLRSNDRRRRLDTSPIQFICWIAFI